jgi:hypothetical protein
MAVWRYGGSGTAVVVSEHLIPSVARDLLRELQELVQ